MSASSNGREKLVLVLQGGGALGAYQAGAYETLASAGYLPDWISGISIGAINSAIIAGNPPERRVRRLRNFWDLVSSSLVAQPLATDDTSRKVFNETSAAFVASVGVPGFFAPRFPPALFHPPGSSSAISIYDTAPLKATLLDLVDFDLINSKRVRLSVGAVHVKSGNMRYFDSACETITPEHIMASGALPPGFPPIAINGEAYWDGGLVSNTPLQYVLEGTGSRSDMCIFQVDLFSARGPMPESLFDIGQREKDIRFSSRTRLNTDTFKTMQTIRRAVKRLEGKLPEGVLGSIDWQLLSSYGCDAAVTIVHLIHRSAPYTTQSGDYEFSRYTIDEHWRAGVSDMTRSLDHPKWKARQRPTEGVAVLDLTQEPPNSPEEPRT